MSKASNLLSSVRHALTGDPNRSTTPSDLSVLPPLGRVLTPIHPAELVPRFQQALEQVAGTNHRVQTHSEIGPLLSGILSHDLASGVVLSRNPLLDRLKLGTILSQLGIPSCQWPSDNLPSDSPTYRNRCFSAAAGITGVDFALAESGSLVLTSATEGAQLSSLAPPIHVAFYLRSQVVETLEEVLQALTPSTAGSPPSRDGRSIVLITGTSRTADIEQILIRGVHGPREVHAILVEDACLEDA